jgi:hypothetical protein
VAGGNNQARTIGIGSNNEKNSFYDINFMYTR